MSFRNGHVRDHEAELLLARLNTVKQRIQDGVDVWRNRQRERYLKLRLREIEKDGTFKNFH